MASRKLRPETVVAIYLTVALLCLILGGLCKLHRLELLGGALITPIILMFWCALVVALFFGLRKILIGDRRR